MASVEAPSRVAQVAATRQLGPLIAGEKGSNPFANAIFALVVSALLFGGVVLVSLLGLTFLRRVLLFGLALSILVLLAAVVSLLIGFRRFFLYSNGLVRWQNGRVRAISWHEATGIRRTRFGKVRTGYAIELASGKEFQVEAVENRETGRLFGEQLEQAATQIGLPIRG